MLLVSYKYSFYHQDKFSVQLVRGFCDTLGKQARLEVSTPPPVILTDADLIIFERRGVSSKDHTLKMTLETVGHFCPGMGKSDESARAAGGSSLVMESAGISAPVPWAGENSHQQHHEKSRRNKPPVLEHVLETVLSSYLGFISAGTARFKQANSGL